MANGNEGKENFINQTEAASLLGLSRARVAQIFKEDECPIVKSGKKGKAVLVNAPEFFKWYLERAISKELKTLQPLEDIVGTMAAEEKRLVAARARKVELETQKLRGEFVPVVDMQILLNEVASDYSMGLESLPGRLSNEIAGWKSPAKIKERILVEIRRLRKSTAGKLRGFRESGSDSEAVGEESRCTFTEDSGSVGRRKKNSSKGKRGARAVRK